MITASFNLKGAQELERALIGLGPTIANKLGDAALRAGAQPIIAEMKATVRRSHINEPHIGDNIATEIDQGAPAGQRILHIGFRKRVSWRVHLLEFGNAHAAAHPFIRPALDIKAQAAFDAMAKSLTDGLEREAAALAKAAP
jgi:HK97 gp10 family phage protein